MAEYEDLLPKNFEGGRTHLTCEMCGFEPKTKNKYRERQDHMLRSHFMHKISQVFPTFNCFNCPSSDCVFIGKDKQSIMRHYIRSESIFILSVRILFGVTVFQNKLGPLSLTKSSLAKTSCP
jgi:hypothetical protein